MTILLNNPVAPNLTKLNKYLKTVNDSGWFTNFGPLHQELTTRLEEYLGVKNLLLVSNGTLALQIAYKALDIKAAVTTPFSFVATSSSLTWQNIPFDYCDIDRNTLNICPRKINEILQASGSSNSSIVATHVYGNPCDVESIKKVSQEKKIKVIYDAAHAFGVKLKGNSILLNGDASTLSFHATKIFHTVEGGAIVFNKSDEFERAKALINFGSVLDGNEEKYHAGINAKLNEYQCAVGLVILDEIDEIIEKRTNLFEEYRDRLKEVCDMPTWHDEASFNGAYMPIVLESADQVQNISSELLRNGVQSRQYFSPSLCTLFKASTIYSTENSKDISNRVLCLPLHYNLSVKNVCKVVDILKKVNI